MYSSIISGHVTISIPHFPAYNFFSLMKTSKNKSTFYLRKTHKKFRKISKKIEEKQDRKVIVKGMKGYVTQAAKEQYGHVAILRILDVVDDSVLVTKSILSVSFHRIFAHYNSFFSRN
jgi:hypothetical protein